MGIWTVMTLCALLIPGLMLLFGRMFQTAPPGEINDWYGYRTKRSKRSPEAWDFAQRYAGRVWQRWGLWTLVLSVGAMLALLGRDVTTASLGGLAVMCLQLIPMLAVIPLTERELKKRFGREAGHGSGETP